MDEIIRVLQAPNSACPGLFFWLLNASYQAGILIGVIWLGLRIFRIKPAPARFYLWLFALLGVALLPAISPYLPHLRPLWVLQRPAEMPPMEFVEFYPPPVSEVTPEVTDYEPILAEEPVEFEPPEAAPIEIMPTKESPWPKIKEYWPLSLTAAWILGAVFFLARLLCGHLAIRRLKSDAREVASASVLQTARETAAKIGLKRNMRLLASSDVSQPATAGIFRPAVILPEEFIKSAGADELKPILIHEFAHIKRSDFLVNLFQRLLEAVFFFHPLIWIASRNLRLTREEICDNWVLEITGERKSYARSLAHFAQVLSARRLPATVALIHRRPEILRRIEMILDERRKIATRLSKKAALLILLTFAFFFPLISAFPFVGEAPVKVGELSADAPGREYDHFLFLRQNMKGGISVTETLVLAKVTPGGFELRDLYTRPYLSEGWKPLCVIDGKVYVINRFLSKPPGDYSLLSIDMATGQAQNLCSTIGLPAYDSGRLYAVVKGRDGDNKLRLFDFRKGAYRDVRSIAFPRPIQMHPIAVSPDHRRVAYWSGTRLDGSKTPSASGQLTVLELDTGKVVQPGGPVLYLIPGIVSVPRGRPPVWVDSRTVLCLRTQVPVPYEKVTAMTRHMDGVVNKLATIDVITGDRSDVVTLPGPAAFGMSRLVQDGSGSVPRLLLSVPRLGLVRYRIDLKARKLVEDDTVGGDYRLKEQHFFYGEKLLGQPEGNIKVGVSPSGKRVIWIPGWPSHELFYYDPTEGVVRVVAQVAEGWLQDPFLWFAEEDLEAPSETVEIPTGWIPFALDQSSPEATWKSFQKAVREKNFEAAYECLSPDFRAKYVPFEEFKTELSKEDTPDLVRYELFEVKITDRDQAVGKIRLPEGKEHPTYFIKIAEKWFLPGSMEVIEKERENAKKHTCRNNLKQIGALLRLYANEYDGFFPPPEVGLVAMDPILDKYRTPKTVLLCPSISDKEGIEPAEATEVCYEYNPRRQLKPEDPPTTPLAWDKKDNHPDGRNVLFVDGHVEWMPEEKFQELLSKEVVKKKPEKAKSPALAPAAKPQPTSQDPERAAGSEAVGEKAAVVKDARRPSTWKATLPSAQAELTLKDIVEAMQANIVLTAQSLKVRYTIRHMSVKTGDVWQTSNYLWASEGEKLFCEKTIHEPGKPEYGGIEAFDGEFSRTYGFGNNTGRIMASPSGIILGDDPRRLYASIRYRSLTDLLAGEGGNPVRLLPQKEVIGEHSCYVIEGDFPKPSKTHFKVWIDAQHDFLPVRIEEISPDWRDIRQVTEFQKLPGNLWFPRQLCRTVFRRKQPEDQDLTKVAIEEYTFHDPEVGQDIDDEMFVLKYPEGAGIWDEILQTGYYVGEAPAAKPTAEAAAESGVSVEDILAALKYNESLVRDFSARCELKVQRFFVHPNPSEPIDPATGQVLYRAVGENERDKHNYQQSHFWAEKGAMVRWDHEDLNSAGEVVRRHKAAFNGELFTAWDSPHNEGVIEPNNLALMPNLYESPATYFLRDTSLRPYSEIDTYEEVRLLKSQEVVGGRLCYVLEEPEHNPFPRTLYVDSERLVLRKVSQFNSKGLLLDSWEVLESIEVSEGIWFPTKIVLRGYIFHSGSYQGQERGCETIVVEPESIKVNSGLPDDLFRITFEPGTEIHDNIAGTTYEYKAPSEKEIDREESPARAPIPQAAVPRGGHKESIMGKIIKAAKTQCEMAEKIECEFTFVDTFPDETYRVSMGLQTEEISGYISFVQFHERFRLVQDPVWVGNTDGGSAGLGRRSSAYDGSLFRSLSESSTCSTTPRGSIYSKVPQIEKGATLLSLIGLRIGWGESLYHELTAGTGQVNYLGTKVQNRMAYEVVSVKYEKGNVVYELSFDPAHNLRLAAWRMTALDGRLYSQASLEYLSGEEDWVFPSAVTVDGFRYRPGESEPVIVRRLHLTGVKARPLAAVSDEVFKISFPPGTEVYDGIVERYYVVGGLSTGEKTPEKTLSPEDAAEKLEEILKGIEFRQAKIKSGRVELVESAFFNGEKHDYEHFSRYIFSGEKRFCQAREKERGRERLYKLLFDGENTTLITTGSASDHPQVDIWPYKHIEIHSNSNAPWLVHSWVDTFDGFKKRGLLSFVKETDLDGEPCYLLEGSGNNSPWRFWISKDKDFALVRQDIIHEGALKIRWQMSDFRHINGIWLAHKVTDSRPPKREEGGKEVTEEYIIEVKEAAFNIPIPEETFKIEIEEGSMVQVYSPEDPRDVVETFRYHRPAVEKVPQKALSTEDAAVKEKLQQLITFHFIDTPFGDVMDFIRVVGDINIVLDPQVVTKEMLLKPVTLKLENVTVESALWHTLRFLDLRFLVKDGVIFISDEKGLEAIKEWKLKAKEGISPEDAPPIHRSALVAEKVLRQRYEKLLSEEMKQAKALIEEEKYEEALTHLNEIKNLIQFAPIPPSDVIDEIKEELKVLLPEVQKKAVEAQRQREQRKPPFTLAPLAPLAPPNHDMWQKINEEQISQEIELAKKFIEKQEFDKAEAILNAILMQDPTEPRALVLLEVVRTEKHLHKVAKLREDAAAKGDLSLEVRVVYSKGKPPEIVRIQFWRPLKAGEIAEPHPYDSWLSRFYWRDKASNTVWKASGARQTKYQDKNVFEKSVPGQYRVSVSTVRPGGHRSDPTPVGASGTIHLDSSKRATTVTVRLEGETSLTIKVTDSETTLPLGGASVLLFRADGLPIGFRQDTDDQGEFRYGHLLSGTYRLRVLKRASEHGQTEYWTKELIRVEVVAGKENVIEVRAPAVQLDKAEIERRWPFIVTGTVTDREGHPMAGVTVLVHCGMGTLYPKGKTTTGADGKYTVRFGPGLRTPGEEVLVVQTIPWHSATVGAYKQGYYEKNLSRQGGLAIGGSKDKEGWAGQTKPLVLPETPYRVDFVMLPAEKTQPAVAKAPEKPLSPEDAAVKEKLQQLITFHFIDTPFGDVMDFVRVVGDINIALDPQVGTKEMLLKPMTLKLENVTVETALWHILRFLDLRFVVKDGVVFISNEEGLEAIKEWKLKAKEDISPEDAAVKEKLQQLITFHFIDTPFGDVMDFTRVVGDINIALDPQVVTKEMLLKPVTLKLENVTVETALWHILRFLDLRFVIKDGVVFISHRFAVMGEPIQAVYDVRDVIAPIRDFEAPKLGVVEPEEERAPLVLSEEERKKKVDEEGEKLAKLIQDTIEPGIWLTPANSVRYRDGQLIVMAPDPIHKEIGELLKNLRKARGLHVQLNLIFIRAAPEFLEEIEKELELKLSLPDENVLSKGDIPVTGYLWPCLKQDELKVLLGRVQKSEKAKIMTAPRVTLFNTQRGYVATTEDDDYIFDIRPVKSAEGEIEKTEEIKKKVRTGVVFDVRPTISADRRDVLMDMYFGHVDIIGFGEITTETGQRIEIPALGVINIKTTLKVPDGETMVAGGLRYTPEEGEEDALTQLLLLVTPHIIIQEEVEERVLKAE